MRDIYREFLAKQQMLREAEGFAYFAWHRLVYGGNTVCRGVNDARTCAVRWYSVRQR